MKLEKRLSPYPILSAGDDDYVRGNFGAHIEESCEFGRLHLIVDYHLDESGLQELISKQQACFVTHVECSLVGFRQMFCSMQLHDMLDIDLQYLVDTVEISTFIMAAEDVEGYRNKDFNRLFGEDGFDIHRGSILAIGPEYIIDVNRTNRSYEKMADILVLQAADDIQESFVTLDSDCLVIHVNRDLLDQYHQHKQTGKNMMISLFILPALVTVLTQMQDDNSAEWCDYRWYQTISRLLEKNGINLSDLNLHAGDDKHSVFILAQKIFHFPLAKALEEMKHREWGEEI